ncbi:hypothetical protein Acr_04g0005840 [Actinidia rufa]|uniref:Uncharacterized protein n=1 Tax=Actinidia rufa TaxID=165716 RepID=A0A7J0EI24_9ERIC|nr:hypothetical protein Acr_04g0005840 [Actinidia rufa]
MSFNTNLGGEESEQSLPSWISDHLGAKSYIDVTNQSTSSPPIPTNSSKMDISSLNKESNVMSQAELDNLGTTYSFPQGVRLRIPGDGETILSARQFEVAFYEAAFLAGLRCLYSLSPLPDSGWYYFKARPEKNLLRGSPSNVKGWKTRESCNKLPTLSEVDAKRMEAVFGKIEPGGYFEVSKILSSRTSRDISRLAARRFRPVAETTRPRGDEGGSGEGKGSVYESPIWDVRSSSDSGSDSIPNFELPPSSDLMLCRPEVKAVAEKAKKAMAAKHPPKGSLFARNVVVFASSLALRSQEHLHDIDFHMARADSAELELVKAQKRAVKAETRLAELNEEISRPGTEVDDLKATVVELTSKLAKAKELAIEDFKASEEFKAAVTDSAATYFGDGFEFCKRQLLHQFPNLGADVANMAIDPSFAEEEEATKEGGDHV